MKDIYELGRLLHIMLSGKEDMSSLEFLSEFSKSGQVACTIVACASLLNTIPQKEEMETHRCQKALLTTAFSVCFYEKRRSLLSAMPSCFFCVVLYKRRLELSVIFKKKLINDR